MRMKLPSLRRALSLAGIAVAGTALTRSFRASARRHAALSDAADRDIGEGTVRPAGPESMRDPPRNWTERDESSDESFPASDPSARY
jgi:hypothetical protein